MEFILEAAQEFELGSRGDVADYSEAFAAAGVAGFKHADVGKAEHVGHFVAYAVPCRVEVGVRRVDGHVVAQGADGYAFGVGASGKLLESAENQRMVAHHHVAAASQSLVESLLRDIKTEKHS